MPKRKPFNELRTRQKQRRLAEELDKDYEELNAELSLPSVDQHFGESNNDPSFPCTSEPSPSSFDCSLQIFNYDAELPFYQNFEESTSNPSYSCTSAIPTNTSANSDENVSSDERSNERFQHFISGLNFDDPSDSEEAAVESSSYSDNDDRDSNDSDRDNNSHDYNSSESSNSENSEEINLEQELGDWYTDSSVTRDQMNALLRILRKAGHNELHRDIRSIVQTPSRTIITPCDPGEYFHFGLEKALTIELGKKNLPLNIVIDVNVDGLPITKTTKRTLWPILGLIVGYKTPFTIGVYHGTRKPEDSEQFLSPFLNEYKKLHQEGFIFMNNTYKVTLRLVINDWPAKCFCNGTKYYNGYYGCPKCTVRGTAFGKKVVFTDLSAPLRNNLSFRNRDQPGHHNYTSPFESIEDFDMVKQFIIDFMHLVLGIIKLLLKLWMLVYPTLSAQAVENLSDAFLNLSPFVPKEFSRKPQSLLELGWWKAATCRLFLLLFGPVILSDHLPTDCVKHFNSLNLAMRILCHPEDCYTNNDNANVQLRYFVSEFKNLYTERNLNPNVHVLIHLAAEAKSYGPLDDISAFPFENYMKFFKKILRKNEKPLQQIHRRLSENRHPSSKREKPNHQWPILSSRLAEPLPMNCINGHKKLKFENFELSTTQPNNCCIVNDEIVVIEYIGERNGEKVIIGRIFMDKQSIPNYPIDSTLVGIYQVDHKSDTLKVFEWRLIKRKACLFEYNGGTYVVSFLHF